MIEKSDLMKMPSGTKFATGTMVDNPEGLHLANTGKMLRWVAIRGHGHYDWAIYAHLEENDIDWIARHGDKVGHAENIKKLINCDDEAMSLYRS